MKKIENVQSRENANLEPPRPEPVFAGIPAGAEPKALRQLIAQQPFLKGLSARHLDQLAESALLMQFEAGQEIFREGDLANRFYLVLDGTVVLESDDAERGRIPIQTLKAGDDLGWSWLFLPHYLHFSARAIEPSKLLFFYGVRLRQQCEEDHELGYELMKRVGQVVVQRLEATQRKLAESTCAKAI